VQPSICAKTLVRTWLAEFQWCWF